MRIRKYKTADRQAVENIHFETGFIGSSMSKLLSNNRLWKSSIAYYLEKERKSAFVLEDNGKVAGYLLGCLYDGKHNASAGFISQTFGNAAKSIFLPKKDRSFWISQLLCLMSILFGVSEELKFKIPKNAGHFHINLLPKARNKGWGTKMVGEFAAYAKKNGVHIIHAESYKTRLNPTTHFWLKNGFKDFSRVKTERWKKQLPNERIFLVCYAKDI